MNETQHINGDSTVTEAEKLLLALLASSEWFTRESCKSAAESYGNGTDAEYDAREYLIHRSLLERNV